MTKKEILRATMKEIRYWIQRTDKDDFEEIMRTLDKCIALNSLLLSMGVLNSDKYNFLYNIVKRILLCKFQYLLD
ncbi:MAG: hypothetical protein HDT39_13290 [Lachnospiraceae bacterium]|nr:hypothetical protein [Lachnospiraceae bacterium]